jgi:tRNA G10  N-methylase Trm11
LALFAESGSLLDPVELPHHDVFDDDLVSIQRYPGKTNEQFTRLLMNLTLAAVRREAPYAILDPLCGRGTTLLTGWTLGHDVAGVEQDEKAIEQLRAFLSTYLRRKRIKHGVSLDPFRREGRNLGRRLEATATLDGRSLSMSVLPGDAADSAQLWGKRTFDAIVADAPYGIVHGAHDSGRRHRSPEALLSAALPVWAGQLRAGGALGLAWNTLTLPRERLVSLVAAAGLTVLDQPPYAGLEHRVDSSILRDVVVATRD